MNPIVEKIIDLARDWVDEAVNEALINERGGYNPEPLVAEKALRAAIEQALGQGEPVADARAIEVLSLGEWVLYPLAMAKEATERGWPVRYLVPATEQPPAAPKPQAVSSVDHWQRKGYLCEPSEWREACRLYRSRCSEQDVQAMAKLHAYIEDGLLEVRRPAAAPQPQPKQEPVVWQPIETAPKDGSTVIIGRDMGDFGFVRGYGRFDGTEGEFCSGWISHGFSEYQSNLGLAHPTHWIPLPPAPDTAPQPQREWVGLTDDEAVEVIESVLPGKLSHFRIARAIEAKLREKNGGGV